MFRALGVVGVVLLVGGVAVAARQAPARSDADSARRKMAAVMARSLLAPGAARSAAPLRTTFTERELNAYLKYDATADLPAGVTGPQVTLPGDNVVEGQAVVDLDAVRRSKPRGMLDPLAYVTGSVQVTVLGTLHVVSGLATFQLDKATLGGVYLPKSLLQELVAYYSKGADHPQGIDIDKPFPMPASIRSLEIQRGGVVVVQ
jgi:hypothetical protein